MSTKKSVHTDCSEVYRDVSSDRLCCDNGSSTNFWVLTSQTQPYDVHVYSYTETVFVNELMFTVSRLL